MAVLWFIHVDVRLSGLRTPCFRYHSQIGRRGLLQVSLPPTPERAREHNRDHVATYHRVLLCAGEARSVRWRSGFYDVQDSSSEAVSKIFGEPNIATELGGTEPNKQR